MTYGVLIGIIVLIVLFDLVVFIRWRRTQDDYDGELRVVGFDEITGNPDLSLTIRRDPIELMAKHTIRLKMVNETK